MTTKNVSTIRIAAVGDLLLTCQPESTAPQRGLEALSAEILQLFASCDIVFANLECTLHSDNKVTSEPRVFSSEAQIRSLKNSGISIVTLGNNHSFDGKDEGFQQLVTLLKELDIPYCGAGKNLKEAQAPTILEVNGKTLAFIAVVDKTSGMTRFAGQETSGVAQLHTGEVCSSIQKLREQVDYVIVSPHWGEERFRHPSPTQIQQAQAFIDAGATLVLGHHPHVLQGMEQDRKAAVFYSLGNFLANEVYWENGDSLTWNRVERTGCIALCEITPEGITQVKQIPIYDDSTSVKIEKSGWGDRCLRRANRLLRKGPSNSSYRFEAFRVRTLLPLVSNLNWKKLQRIRPGHLRKLFSLFTDGLK
jgi:poly-gamma-glutamate synthesis protein (capsule biosynthesis protein)